MALLILMLYFGPAPAQAAEPQGEILFYSEHGGKGQLYLLELGGGEIRPVGRSGSRPDHYPQWSPDGERIVFESYRKGGWHPWVMDADGGNARRVSNLPGGSPRNYEFDPSFAPDGETVVMIRDFDLYRVPLRSQKSGRIGAATPDLYEIAPVASPDGERIAFAGFRESDDSVHLYTVDRAGKDRRQLTSGKGWNLAPAWSPDGRHLLFYSNRDGSFELYELAAAGGDSPRRVLQSSAAEEAGFTKTALIDPWDNDNGAVEQYRASYSPDGRWIVFSREIDDDRELFVCDRAGRDIRRLTRRPGLDGMAAWRPRGAAP
ncbi:MAG: hypothetical protein AAF604_19760 [Acidobacteriota bacterium]